MSDISWSNDRRALRDLRPQPDNPRQLMTAEAERLATSWEDYGQVTTLAIGPDGELYNGHQRYQLLLKRYGPDYEVDVRIASRQLDHREWQRLTVLLHEGTVGEWDYDALANWEHVDIDDLLDWGFDESTLELGGFSDNGAEKPEDPGAQIDKAAELQAKWETALGQVWEVGRHRVVCGDCTQPAIVEALMQGKQAGAVITDPPYGIEREGILNDDPDGLLALYSGCLSILPVENAVIVAFQSPRLFYVWLDATRHSGFKSERLLWMYKPNDETYPWRGWLQKSEAIHIGSRGKPVWLDVHPYAQDCYVYKHTESLGFLQGIHTSVKPLMVVQDLVSRIGGLVCDPFLGSGTTLIACERLQRQGFGIELSPGYVAVTLERLAGMGLEPKLAGTVEGGDST